MDSLIDKLEVGKSKAQSVLSALIILTVLVSWVGILDKPSEDYVDKALVKTGLAFAAARGLNAAISTLQSTTVSVQAVGGVAVTIGEVLDPLNDLVEQYASLMKLSIGSLFIQKIILEVVTDSFFKIVVTISGLALLLAILLKDNPYISILSKTFVFAIFLRFLFVLVVLMSSVVSRSFIDKQTVQDVEVVEALTADIEQPQALDSLTEEERALINVQLGELRVESQETTDRLTELDGGIVGLEEDVSFAEERYEEIQSSVSVSDRLLRRNADLNSARELLNETQNSLRSLTDERDELSDRLVALQEPITIGENTLAGISTTFIERIRSSVDTFASSVSLQRVKERIELAITNILRIMSLFILETLILPLMFLFVFSKGMKFIWGIDFRELIQTKPSEQAVT